MKYKAFFAALLAAVLLISLAACTGTATEEVTPSAQTEAPAAPAAPQPAPAAQQPQEPQQPPPRDDRGKSASLLKRRKRRPTRFLPPALCRIFRMENHIPKKRKTSI